MPADIHCHILPKLDDGAENFSVTETMLKASVKEGIDKIIATPHYNPNLDFPIKKVYNTFTQAKTLIDTLSLPMELYLGCEIFYSNPDKIIQGLKANTILTLIDTPYVLIEFPIQSSFNYIYSAVKSLLYAGFFPVLAHIERYGALTHNINYIEKLIAYGGYIQINTSSILGENGSLTQKFTKNLLKKRLVHFLGTDSHNCQDRKPKMKKALKKVKRYVDKSYYFDLTENNFEILKKGILL